MLSEKDYSSFARKVSKILRKCYFHTEYPGQEPERLPDGSLTKILAVPGCCSLTKEYTYIFNATKAQEHREELLEICASLPKLKTVITGTAGTIACADLLPEKRTTLNDLKSDCEHADKFIALLFLNGIGVPRYLDFDASSSFSSAPIDLYIKYKDRVNPDGG